MIIKSIIALGAGFISFLSPCVLPIIPGYISYISGTSLNELIEKKNINLIPIILFTIGFSIVFIIFGAASTFLGQVLLQNSNEILTPVSYKALEENIVERTVENEFEFKIKLFE